MLWLEYLAVFFIGTAAGSFLNVVIYRVPKGISIIKPDSHCPYCKRPIKPWENVPVFSYVILRGKCAGCGAAISIRYLAVEVLMGCLMMLLLFHFGWTWNLLIYGILAALLLALSVIDIETYRLPNPIVLTGSILAAGLTLAFRPDFLLKMILGASVGIGVMAFQGFAGWLIVRVLSNRKTSALGFGDVKFAGMIGLFLGPAKTGGMYIFGIFLGAAFSIVMLATQNKRFGQRIPFGPYLAGGALISLLWGEQIWVWYSSFLLP